MAAEAGPAGAFELEHPDSENFNLKPRDSRHGPIPEDQRKINQEVYEARNIPKLLKAQGAFRRQGPAYDEFMERVVQAARSGCVAPHGVDTNLAASALEQIRADVTPS